VGAAERGWQRLWNAVQLVRTQRDAAPAGPEDEQVVAMLAAHRDGFQEKMNDDFNAPGALGVLQELTREVNTLINEGSPLTRDSLAAIDALYGELAGDVLGILPTEETGSTSAERQEGLIQLLVELRSQARANRDWATADQIRDELAALGVHLEDRPDGTIWKVE
jgi:cysteinyl-tRNA synthetase